MLTKKPMKRNLPERRRMCFIVCHVLLISACAIVAQAQNRQVVGKIRDAQGAVLPGVNVVLKGTSSGTVSDANGDYAIDIGTGDNILVFTFVGYVAQEIPLRGGGGGAPPPRGVALQKDAKKLSKIFWKGKKNQRKTRCTET